MLISHKHKFITVDIPKTGTRSLRESLSPLHILEPTSKTIELGLQQHSSANNTRLTFKKVHKVAHGGYIPVWDDYFKYTVVRNPWQRYFSFFKYYKNYGEMYLRQDASIKWDVHTIAQGKLCVELFENKDNQSVLKYIMSIHPCQDKYYCNGKGEVLIDHIAEFENLQKEFAYFCNRVGVVTPNLVHSNKSTSSLDMQDIYNQELIDLVADKEQHVIQLKSYDY
jgi:hypothetical protein